MSLDFTLRSKRNREQSGTGVFIRKNGQIIELRTIEEVKAMFPDADISNIKVREYETNVIFDKNITHNLTEMADNIKCSDGKVSLYNILWHPSDSGFIIVTEQYRKYVAECLSYMLTHRQELEKFNPPNGWGSYDVLCKFVIELAEVLSSLDGEEEISIIAYT